MNENNQDIRWRQRFSNFSRAFGLLGQSLAIQIPSEAERAGLIQFFEMSFELAWKVLKDYLEIEGFAVNSPRSAIKQAFQIGLITDGQVWMEALTDRNLTFHTYDEAIAIAVERKIRTEYFPILNQLSVSMQEKVKN